MVNGFASIPPWELGTSAAKSFTFSWEWELRWLAGELLPSDRMKGSAAFVKEDEVIVGHGGISIEEVIVPFGEV